MKKTIGWVLLLSLGLTGFGHTQNKATEFPILQGPYLGQKPPGMKPEIFAPGIISIVGREYDEADICFWPDGKRCIFARFGPDIPEFVIFESRIVDSVWSQPGPSPVIHMGGYLPCVSPDGQEIVFTTAESVRKWPTNLYVTRHEKEGWSSPKSICTGMYPSMTLDGTMYYADNGTCVFRRKIDGVYQDREIVGKHIYPGHAGGHPGIAPDESYLVFGDGGLFVSFRTGENAWSKPQNMTDRLGLKNAGKPRVTYDGKYIFFYSNGDIYWVDAKIIEEFKPEGLK